MLESKDKVIVAVSGGADSTAMLLALKELVPEYNLQLYVAHLNHMMRGGDQAEADATGPGAFGSIGCAFFGGISMCRR